jgi:hypothetical protein
VSLQVAILKVLASYPDGRATLAAMKADLAILAGAGPAWGERLRWLAARIPDLDIFSDGFVVRDAAGWQLTGAGREVLIWMEATSPSETQRPGNEPMAAPLVVVERMRPGNRKGKRRRRRRRLANLVRSA